MEQVTIRELSQDTAGILARVEAGESLEVTKQGKPIARLVPVRPGNGNIGTPGRVGP
jgi:prevent-host-death family protein